MRDDLNARFICIFVGLTLGLVVIFCIKIATHDCDIKKSNSMEERDAP